MPLTPATPALAKAATLLSATEFCAIDTLLDVGHTGGRHLCVAAETFQKSLLFSRTVMEHFTEELVLLIDLLENPPGCAVCRDLYFFGAVQACAFGLVEDMALFMREKKLRAGCAPQPEPEERIMAFFETSGNWPKGSGEIVIDYYYTQIPLAVMRDARQTAK